MKLSVELLLPSSNPDAPLVRAVDAGQKDWKFNTELQDGELYYRTKLSGSLLIGGADFTWLYEQWQQFPCCVEVQVNVFTPNCESGEYELFWPGYFLMDAVRWDFVTCQATVREVLPRDGYDALYRQWNKAINVLTPQQPLDNVPFVALYADAYTTEFKDDGTSALVLPDGNAAGTGYLGLEHVYSRGIRVMDVLNRLVSASVAGTAAQPLVFGFTSEFYTAYINPVNGRLNGTKVLLAGSDAKRPASITPAVKMVMTLKELLDELKALHNVWHLIDAATGQLRLEHYSWFAERSYAYSGRVSLNLTKYPDALKKANNESVDLESLYGVEELRIENNAGSVVPQFKSGSVRYDGACTVKDDKGESKVNTMTASRVFTDLMTAYRNPESVGDDTIFLADVGLPHSIANVVSFLPVLIVETSDIPTIPVSIPGLPDSPLASGIGNNGTQSAATLFREFHRHGRSFTQGLVNAIKLADGSYSDGQRMAMLSTTNSRRQENIVITLCCTDLPLNLDGYVKTNRFERAQLGKGVFDPATDELTLDVVAPSRCQGTVLTPPDPGSDDCPASGKSLGTKLLFTFGPDGTTVIDSRLVEVFADGNCGTYELPFTIYVPPVTLNP